MLKHILFLLVFISLCSCGDETSPELPNEISEPEVELNRNEYGKHIWVCHNPESNEHGKKCEDDKCLVPGDNSKFCWLLNISQCFEDIRLPYNEVCEQI